MLKRIRLVLLLPMAGLLACGSSAPVASPTSAFNFTGDWGARATSSSYTLPINQFLGTLSASGGVVSGALTSVGSPGTPCFATTITPVTVSGTVDSSGNLTVTLPVAGGTATLTAMLTTNFQTLASGTYQIVGGTCAMSTTPMVIAQYAALNGTYIGTFNIPNSMGLPTLGTATTVTAILTQSATPNSNAEFPVTGSVTTTGACVSSFTLSNAIVWGGSLISGSGPDSLSGIFDPTGSTAQLAVFTSGTSTTNCPYTSSQYFDGTLTHQ